MPLKHTAVGAHSTCCTQLLAYIQCLAPHPVPVALVWTCKRIAAPPLPSSPLWRPAPTSTSPPQPQRLALASPPLPPPPPPRMILHYQSCQARRRRPLIAPSSSVSPQALHPAETTRRGPHFHLHLHLHRCPRPGPHPCRRPAYRSSHAAYRRHALLPPVHPSHRSCHRCALHPLGCRRCQSTCP